jgi:hypothetical protein
VTRTLTASLDYIVTNAIQGRVFQAAAVDHPLIHVSVDCSLISRPCRSHTDFLLHVSGTDFCVKDKHYLRE